MTAPAVHFLVVTSLAAVIVVADIAWRGVETAVRAESGAVEMLSFMAVLYGAVLAVPVVRRIGTQYWHLPALLAVFALRELDFHDWFFEPGLLHADIFSAPVPVWQKAVSGLTMALLLVILGRTVLLGARPFLSGLRAGAGWNWAIVAAGGLAALSIVFDETRKAWFDVTGVDYGWKTVMSVAEEVAELGMALLLVLALLLALAGQRRVGR